MCRAEEEHHESEECAGSRGSGAYPQAPLVLVMLLYVDISAASSHKVAPAIGVAVSVWHVTCSTGPCLAPAADEWRGSRVPCKPALHVSCNFPPGRI